MSNRFGLAGKGFTLIEILISLAIFATVATTIYARTGDTIFQLQSMERRTVAHWLAMDTATLAQLERQNTTGAISDSSQSKNQIMASREWRIESVVSSTNNPLVHRLEVNVYLLNKGEEVGPIETYVSFLGRY